MEKKVEKLLEINGTDLKNIWEGYVFSKIKDCESPIEKLFLIEWYYKREIYSLHYFIKSQYKINNYRVDFMISIPNKENILIVELDSYLWHGSKSEQFANEKKRERELKKEGYNIMRFSGREIYRDVEKCVEEVIQYLNEIEIKLKEEE